MPCSHTEFRKDRAITTRNMASQSRTFEALTSRGSHTLETRDLYRLIGVLVHCNSTEFGGYRTHRARTANVQSRPFDRSADETMSKNVRCTARRTRRSYSRETIPERCLLHLRNTLIGTSLAPSVDEAPRSVEKSANLDVSTTTAPFLTEPATGDGVCSAQARLGSKHAYVSCSCLVAPSQHTTKRPTVP